jgi:hypothetical protein
LSPRIEPPVLFDVGSTANTATLFPSSINFDPKASIKVDFPAPGVPDKAILIDLLSLLVNKSLIRLLASFLCLGSVDSTNVIALARA